MDSREQFEAWECEAPEGPQVDPMWLMRCTLDPNNYGILQVQSDWEAWQASRDVIEIALPDKWGDYTEVGFEHNAVIDQVKEILEAAGLKVKP